MKITIKCVKCNQIYKVDMFSSRINGPVIHSTCPFCKYTFKRNIATFIEKNVLNIRLIKKGDYSTIRDMQQLANRLERIIIYGQDN